MKRTSIIFMGVFLLLGVASCGNAKQDVRENKVLENKQNTETETVQSETEQEETEQTQSVTENGGAEDWKAAYIAYLESLQEDMNTTIAKIDNYILAIAKNSKS